MVNKRGKGREAKAGYLLITNREFALRLLVVLGKNVEGLDGLALENRQGELDVGFGVLVAGLPRGRVINVSMCAVIYVHASGRYLGWASHGGKPWWC